MKLLSYLTIILTLGCTSRHNSTATTLDLSNRNLTSIPDSVYSLTHLEHLQLGNDFTLYPPLSALGRDSYDSTNKITEISKDITKLRQLRTLGLCFNDLRSLPKEIINLKKLDTLDISFNVNFSLASQFETLKQLKWLKYLNIIATNSDNITIDKLRHELPKTKLFARLEDLRSTTENTYN